MDQKIDRQPYRDGTLDEATKKHYDIVQLKYDGWWDRIEINDGLIQHYSQSGRLFKEQRIDDRALSCTLIGEHMIGTQWSQDPGRLGVTFLFDCWRWEQLDLKSLSYFDRYRVMRIAPTRLPETFKAVQCYKTAQRDELWSVQVESGAFEGLVYRRGCDDVTHTILREKRIITDELCCTGFEGGLGKFEDTLGAIIARTKDDVEIRVGGGFTDDERHQIWDARPFYLGRWFEVEARARFESGSLRHPNFVRWRLDK